MLKDTGLQLVLLVCVLGVDSAARSNRSVKAYTSVNNLGKGNDSSPDIASETGTD